MDKIAVSIDPSRPKTLVPPLRGAYFGDSPEPLHEDDLARMAADTGLTCIRYGMEHKDFTSEAGFRKAANVLDWCARYNIACVMDLHNTLGRMFGGDPRLWRDENFRILFLGLWRALVTRFKDHPAVAAWELLNEPEPPNRDYAVWNDLHKRSTELIRSLDPHHTIIIDCIGYANAREFVGLKPSGDKNVVYSFHTYAPGPYHCQKRRELADQSTYYYPGFIPAKAPDKPLDFNQAHGGAADGMFWNRAQLLESWSAAFKFRNKHKVPLFCGEFGCVSDVPPMTDMVYLMDNISLFQEESIPWTIYNGVMRTADEYWRSHFDCAMYVAHSADDKTYAFRRKIALLEFFCRTEGSVLAVSQPKDDLVGVYAVKEPSGNVSILISNKSRDTAKDITVSVSGLPGRWPAVLRTLDGNTDRFAFRGNLALARGTFTATTSPLSITQVRVPATPNGSWPVAAPSRGAQKRGSPKRSPRRR